MFEQFSPYFLFTDGLQALYVLIPFLLLYFVRPKPRRVIMPSLMFLMKDSGKANIFSHFISKFIQDLLFYLQFLALLLLALAIAKPFIEIPSLQYADTLVVVIDDSASMNTREGAKTRFEKAIDIAKERLESENTVILASAYTEILVEKAAKIEAEVMLNRREPKHTPSNLYDSVILAEKFIDSDAGAVLVLSDFASQKDEQEFLRAKSYLEAKGIDVYFERVSTDSAKNVGFIDLDITETTTTAWVKNFNNESLSISATYGDTDFDFELAPYDVRSITMSTRPGVSSLSLNLPSGVDHYPLDNTLYISTPAEQSLDVLYLKNQDETFLEAFFNLNQKLLIRTQVPPTLEIGDPDLIIIGKVNSNILIPGDIKTIKELVHAGTPLIVLAQDGLLNIGITDLLPIDILKQAPTEEQTLIQPYNEESHLTPGEILFGTTVKYFESAEKEGTSVHAETEYGAPVISSGKYGNGNVLYYGLYDEQSEFKSDIFYPIFWKRSIDLLIGGKTLGELNKRTGQTVYQAREQEVQTPTKIETKRNIPLTHNGIYKFNDYTLVANLLNDNEQKLNRDSISLTESKLITDSDLIEEETKDFIITDWLLYVIAGLLLLELLIIKMRGDL